MSFMKDFIDEDAAQGEGNQVEGGGARVTGGIVPPETDFEAHAEETMARGFIFSSSSAFQNLQNELIIGCKPPQAAMKTFPV